MMQSDERVFCKTVNSTAFIYFPLTLSPFYPLYTNNTAPAKMAIAGALRKQVLKVLMLSLLIDLVRSPNPPCRSTLTNP